MFHADKSAPDAAYALLSRISGTGRESVTGQSWLWRNVDPMAIRQPVRERIPDPALPSDPPPRSDSTRGGQSDPSNPCGRPDTNPDAGFRLAPRGSQGGGGFDR